MLARADGAILLRTRPAKGLLGGMAEVPTSEWRAGYELDGAAQDAPLPLRWLRPPEPVRHVFAHFPLELTVLVGRVPAGTEPPPGMRFTAPARLAEEALPSVCLKVVEAGLEALRPLCHLRLDLAAQRVDHGEQPYRSTCQKVQPLQAGRPCASAPTLWIEPTAGPSTSVPSARTIAL